MPARIGNSESTSTAPSTPESTPTRFDRLPPPSPPRKLFLFGELGPHDDQTREFGCISHPGLPISEIPKFPGPLRSILRLPIWLHVVLTKTINELNRADRRGHGWVLVTARRYKDDTVEGAFFAAVLEKSGATYVSAAEPSTIVGAVVNDTTTVTASPTASPVLSAKRNSLIQYPEEVGEDL